MELQRLQGEPVERELQDYELDLNRHPEQVAWHGDDLHDPDHHGLQEEDPQQGWKPKAERREWLKSRVKGKDLRRETR